MRSKRMFVSVIATVALVGLISIPTPCVAIPVQYAGTGNYYEFVVTSLTWTDAQTAAADRSYNGVSGHLATITSEDENTFLDTTFDSTGWLGGSDAAAEGTWRWTDGPEAGTNFWNGGSDGSAPPGQYANWGDGEPSNLGENQSTEQYLVLFSTGFWNDATNNANESTVNTPTGYYVEFEAIPIPGAVWLLGSGLIGIVGIRRKFKK